MNQKTENRVDLLMADQPNQPKDNAEVEHAAP